MSSLFSSTDYLLPVFSKEIFGEYCPDVIHEDLFKLSFGISSVQLLQYFLFKVVKINPHLFGFSPYTSHLLDHSFPWTKNKAVKQYIDRMQ